MLSSSAERDWTCFVSPVVCSLYFSPSRWRMEQLGGEAAHSPRHQIHAGLWINYSLCIACCVWCGVDGITCFALGVYI